MFGVAPNHEKLPPPTIDQILQNFASLEFYDRQQLREYLSTAYLHTVYIRENILEEGKKIHKGILILEGTLLITKKIPHGRLILAQLNPLQIANIEVFLYDKVCYTVSVHSSQLKYVFIPEDLLLILFNYFRTVILQKQSLRTTEINNKIQELTTRSKLLQRQKIINNLSLPLIKYDNRQCKIFNPEINERRRQLTCTSEDTEEIQHIFSFRKPIYSSPKLRSSKSKQQQAKLHNTNKTKSAFLNLNRNEKLFNERLKTIMKRKLAYQRKQQRKVKECFTDKFKQTAIWKKTGNVRPSGNQIDQYFNI